MRRLRGVLSSVLFGGIIVFAVGAPVTSNDPETNRRLLAEIRTSDPEQYARLDRHFERFRAMSPEKQEQLRRFDRQFHDEDSQTQARLTRVLSEYAAWLTRLPERDQQRVQATAGNAERLRVIREIKERQWLEHLPRVQYQEWQAAPETKRKELVERWKKDEQKQREQWVDARRHWEETPSEPPMPPAMQEETARQMKQFVEKRLYPMLNANERERIRRAEEERLSAPFALLRSIVDLSERHPVLALEPQYVNFAALPDEYKKALKSLPTSAQAEVKLLPIGIWPRYPEKVTELLRKYNAAPKQQLGPATAKEFPANVADFIETKLKPKLTTSEKDRLKKAEGRWPDYPLLLHELAREHKLVIPELSLPIDPQRLERMKPRRPFAGVPLPEPPEYLLRQFALKLIMENPDGPSLSLNNPADREIIKKKFFEKNPEMLKRLRQQDEAKLEMKKKKAS